MKFYDFQEYKTPDMKITKAMKESLRSISVWTIFLAILEFIFAALHFVSGIANFYYNNAAGILAGFINTFIAIFTCFIAVSLYRASKNISEAIKKNDTSLFEEGMRNLVLYWKLTGIMVIVVIMVYTSLVLFASFSVF